MINKLKPEHDYEQVEEYPHLVRDTYSKAITNSDNAAYANYMSAALKRKERQSQLENQQDEINSIKEEMSDIKDMLGQILNKVNGN